MSQPAWIKSRRCDSSACVEVADLGAHVGVRNSTEPNVQLGLPRDTWEGLRLDILEGGFRFPKEETA